MTTELAPDPVLATNDLADALAHASTRLFNERRDAGPDVDVRRLLALEVSLDSQSIALRAQAVHLLGDRAADATAALQGAALRVDRALAELDRLGDVLSAVSATLTLAGAALSGDASGVLKAVGGVDDALKALRLDTKRTTT